MSLLSSDPRRNLGEAFFWSLVCLTALCTALVITSGSLLEFSAKPLGLEVATTRHDPAKVPFPALTLCPDQALDQLNVAAIKLNQVVVVLCSLCFFGSIIGTIGFYLAH